MWLGNRRRRVKKLGRDHTKIALPLVLRRARIAGESHGYFGKDAKVEEDPLPPVIETNGTPQLPRDSKFTRVGGETTDDR
jgi:hypothetical protein